MENKKVPERKCVACGERRDKRDLVRAVRTPSGEIVLDLTGKLSGRGAYLCRDAACLRRARKGDRLGRALG
ncbi:MAG: YlxR family protein, partial [Clostridia bacterium]|nr:YlxR family protein [Clostridia bacterium]